MSQVSPYLDIWHVRHNMRSRAVKEHIQHGYVTSSRNMKETLVNLQRLPLTGKR